ncbi:MAG TPA: hypothetical protein VEI06_06780 [Gemmatimonadaceae bacterium]|nr:hypothetical protein [Gemmatimonadaceae bacterium]
MRRDRATRAAHVGMTMVVVGAVGALTLWACADFTSPVDPTGGLPDVVVANPMFERDIQPMFTKRCAQGGCHTVASAQVGLVLAEGYSYDALVNHASSLSDVYQRVLPGDHTNSWLWRMLQSDQSLRPTYPEMPLAAQPLTGNQLQTIVNWIDEGAPRN